MSRARKQQIAFENFLFNLSEGSSDEIASSDERTFYTFGKIFRPSKDEKMAGGLSGDPGGIKT